MRLCLCVWTCHKLFERRGLWLSWPVWSPTYAARAGRTGTNGREPPLILLGKPSMMSGSHPALIEVVKGLRLTARLETACLDGVQQGPDDHGRSRLRLIAVHPKRVMSGRNPVVAPGLMRAASQAN